MQRREIAPFWVELDVPIFGCRGSLAGKPWEAIARDIKARGAVRVVERR